MKPLEISKSEDDTVIHLVGEGTSKLELRFRRINVTVDYKYLYWVGLYIGGTPIWRDLGRSDAPLKTDEVERFAREYTAAWLESLSQHLIEPLGLNVEDMHTKEHATVN